MTLKSMARTGGLAFCLIIAMTGLAQAGPKQNAKLVKEAVTALFIKRDVTAIDRYWGKTYIQHNPQVANGPDALKGLAGAMPTNFKYEMGAITASGDLVMVRGRYTGFGPKPMVGVDMFRIKEGKIVEHWDVLQEEVPTSQTKSGNPMFEPGL